MKQDPKPKIVAKEVTRLCDQLVSQDTKLADASPQEQHEMLTMLQILIGDNGSPIIKGDSKRIEHLGEYWLLPILLPTGAQHDIYFDIDNVVDSITGKHYGTDLRCVDGASPAALAQISQSLKDWLEVCFAEQPFSDPKLSEEEFIRQCTESTGGVIKRAEFVKLWGITGKTFDRVRKKHNIESVDVFGGKPGYYASAEVFQMAINEKWPLANNSYGKTLRDIKRH